MADGSPLLSRAIVDYQIGKESTVGYKATCRRLAMAILYLSETGAALTCAQADEAWITHYRAWLTAKGFALGHVEGCVRQLAAAINATHGQKAKFRAEQPKAVSKSPVFRAGVADLANMFNYCLRPNGRTAKIRAQQIAERANLLRYLRMAVATWARPDAIFDAGPAQWHPAPRVLDMNLPGRRQTKKHRPRIVIARQFAPFLDDGDAFLPICAINQPWTKMRVFLHLPGGREAGPKLIRRSMATIARKRIGEANWRQGEMMLGHIKTSISDIYALPDPANLGLALAATESIIDEIETMAPGAFDLLRHRTITLMRVIG